MDISKLKQIEIKDFSKKMVIAVIRKSGWIWVAFFIAILVYSAYLWNEYVLDPGWDEVRRIEYINSKQKEAVFNRDKFDGVISELEKREARFKEDNPNSFDIFRLE